MTAPRTEQVHPRPCRRPLPEHTPLRRPAMPWTHRTDGRPRADPAAARRTGDRHTAARRADADPRPGGGIPRIRPADHLRRVYPPEPGRRQRRAAPRNRSDRARSSPTRRSRRTPAVSTPAVRIAVTLISASPAFHGGTGGSAVCAAVSRRILRLGPEPRLAFALSILLPGPQFLVYLVPVVVPAPRREGRVSRK